MELEKLEQIATIMHEYGCIPLSVSSDTITCCVVRQNRTDEEIDKFMRTLKVALMMYVSTVAKLRYKVIPDSEKQKYWELSVNNFQKELSSFFEGK